MRVLAAWHKGDIRLRDDPRAVWSFLSFLLLLVATFALPYCFPVRPSVSVSYVTHFSNRAAVVLFAVCGIAFAAVSPWARVRAGRDSTLSGWLLGVVLVMTVLLCRMRVFTPPLHFPGAEAYYNLDRLHKLASGARPYRDFEYAYGPLLLYGPLWLAKLAHLPLLGGYYAFWTMEWAVGTALLWYAVRYVAIPNGYRVILFLVLWVNQVSSVMLEGISYTPVRTLDAAGLVVLLHRLWLRYRNGWVLTGAALVVGCLGMGFALELGISILAGVGMWLAVLALRGQIRGRQLAPYLLGVVAVVLAGSKLKMFATMMDFGAGSFSFPLVLSLPVALLLMPYLACLCVAAQDVRAPVGGANRSAGAGDAGLPAGCVWAV